MSSRKFYWLKLKEDFFDEDTIQWLEEQDNGKEYCLFYLKLCLKSLKSDGLLIRNVGNILIPYDAKKLGEITGTETDTVRVAMEIFKNIGLVQVLENGEIYLTQLENMVGSETKWAEKKRLQRKKKDNVPRLSAKCPREIEKEIEKEIDIEIEKDTEIDSNYVGFFNNNFHLISPYEKEILESFEKDGLESTLITFALQRALDRNKRSIDYVKGILNNWLKDNIKTVEQAKVYSKARGDKKIGSTRQDNANSKPKQEGEGEKLARRAIEKYGDKLEDFECDF